MIAKDYDDWRGAQLYIQVNGEWKPLGETPAITFQSAESEWPEVVLEDILDAEEVE